MSMRKFPYIVTESNTLVNQYDSSDTIFCFVFSGKKKKEFGSDSKTLASDVARLSINYPILS